MSTPQLEAAITLLKASHQMTALAINLLAGDHPAPDAAAIVKEALSLIKDDVPQETQKVQKVQKVQKEPSAIDPDWFKPGDNRHLTPKGEKHIYSLFDDGMSINQAAKAMGIYYWASKLRHDKWLKIKDGNLSQK